MKLSMKLSYMDSVCHAISGDMWTPHGLRVMDLRSWRTLICWLEAPKGQRSQSAYKEEII